MKLYIITYSIIFIFTGTVNSQSMFENIFSKKPEYINVRNINKEVEYWTLTKNDFDSIQEEYDLELIENLSELENDLKVFKINDYCLVEEQGNYTIFKRIKDVEIISSNYQSNRIYDPIEEFNHLGKDFIEITYLENRDLYNLTGLNLNHDTKSLDDLDVYINSLDNTSDFILENRLILMAYLGNVFIKNSKDKFSWEVLKTDTRDFWEVFLINKETGKKIEISKWFLEYVYEEETQIIGMKGVYDSLRINIGNEN